MQSTQITFEDMAHTPELSRSIRDKCESLDRIHPDIRHCRVNVRPVAGPPRMHAVTVRVGLPDRELVVDEVRHFDPYLAVREAFTAMRRRLNAHVETVRGTR